MEAKGRGLFPAKIDFHNDVGKVAADYAEAVLEVPTLNELERAVGIATPWLEWMSG
jgi:hypothetical protein